MKADDCLLSGNCQVKNIVYQATVKYKTTAYKPTSDDSRGLSAKRTTPIEHCSFGDLKKSILPYRGTYGSK